MPATRIQKFKDTFTQFDAFGDRVNFTVKGRETFGAIFGTVLTIFIYATVLVYAQMRVQRLYYRLDTFHQTAHVENVIAQDKKFTFEELGANFMFSLWSNNFMIPHNLSQIEDYVQFDAVISSKGFENQQPTFKVEKLPLHPCSDEDKFFEPVDG